MEERSIHETEPVPAKKNNSVRLPKWLYRILLIFFAVMFTVSLVLIARYAIESFRTSQGYNDLANLKESLQKPYYPGSKSGKVLVRVTVNSQGLVTSATFEPVGSTTSDSQLVEAAIAAARKARFTESNAAVAGGTITYVFNITKD